jgi:hypothetical protein
MVWAVAALLYEFLTIAPYGLVVSLLFHRDRLVKES